MKKLIPALALLLVSAVLLATSSFAWFSMNTTVTVTGMEVTTKVGSNLSISHDTVANTTKNAENTFTSTDATAVTGLIEPVSTIDGLNFFYTASRNVNASGAAIAAEYVAYDPADTSAFVANSVAGAVGYVDYAFQLKAINADAVNAQYINLKTLNLAYKGTAGEAINAFRVAIFVEKYDSAFHTVGTAGTTTLMKNASAANRTATKAVNSVSTLGDVTYGAFNYITVAAGETAYYKVVVRLWIEGEDTQCKNDTFVTLSDKWELDMEWELVDDTSGHEKAPKANITNGTYLLVAGNYTVTAEGKQTISATAYNVVTGLTYNGKQVYTTAAAGTLGTTASLFTIAGGVATDVTANFNLK